MNRFLILGCLGLFTLPAFSQVETRVVSREPSFIADDGSVIRAMPRLGDVESVHCLLPKGGAIQACRHRTVSQIWFVIAGRGEMWLRSPSGEESVTPLDKGTSLTVPLGYSFQFRNTGESDLEIFIVNTTPWSGEGELIRVENHWQPHVPRSKE